MKINVLLTVYNGSKYLAEQIDSILNQSVDSVRLYIRDDGSADNSRDIIEKYCRKYPSRIISVGGPSHNIGQIMSINELLGVDSTADYYMFADQDDVWLSDKIRLTLERMKELEATHPGIPVLVCTDATCVDKDLNCIHQSFFEFQRFPTDTFESTTKMMALNVVQGCTVMINAAARSLVYPFPDWIKVHDLYMSVKVADNGIVDYLHRQTLLYRQHDGNALGAVNVGLGYFVSRSFRLFDTMRLLKRYSDGLHTNPSMPGVLFHKIRYSIRRMMFKRKNNVSEEHESGISGEKCLR